MKDSLKDALLILCAIALFCCVLWSLFTFATPQPRELPPTTTVLDRMEERIQQLQQLQQDVEELRKTQPSPTEKR